jgi:tyrosine-protein kinase Etk/Wzc
MKKVAMEMGLIDRYSPESEVFGVVSGLQGKVNTETIERTNIIRITALSGDPKQAVELANTTAKVYVEENLLEKKRQASTARQFIEEQLGGLEDRLLMGEEELRVIADETKDIELAEPIQKKLIELEFQLAALLQKYTEKHPQVLRLREQISDLERQLSGFSGEDLRYARLAREVEVNKKLYAMLKEKLEEARITEAEKVGDASIVDPAILSDEPVGQQKVVGTFIGAIMGIVLGMGLAFLSEAMDTSIGTIEEVEKFVKLPVLGVIPSVESRKSAFGRLRAKLFHKRKTDAEEAYIRLIVQRMPKSPIAESYRHLRTSLKLSSTVKTILITSAGPREGKGTVLTNLGLTTAQRGLKTLLVSSDLRRPTLAKTFGVKQEPGFNEVISGAVKLENALRTVTDMMLGEMHLDDILRMPGIENISILPSGHIPPNPAEVLESRELSHIMEELKSKFEVILLDSPPVLLVTDPMLIASKVDSVVICHETGRTARAALLRTKTQLESSGARIAGVVLNHIAPRSEIITQYPYYRSYRSYGYYGEDKQKKRKS